MEKSRVLVVGGTGYIGRRIVNASLASDHPTYILQRPEIGLDIDKLQILLSFKKQGAHLVEGSFSDHKSLVEAVKLVDVVISAISGVHFRSHQILLQLKLVKAMKEAGNVNRFLPSEFGIDPARMAHALEPGRAIEEAGILHTYVSANCFAGYFVGGLCEPGRITPARNKVCMFGDGAIKAVFVDEEDIGTYIIKAIDDPRTLNKTLYIRPPENILSQRELVEIWESLLGKVLQKSQLSEQDFLDSMRDVDIVQQIGLGHYYQVFYEGCLTNFEIGGQGVEASQLYPEVNYTRVRDYLKQYL
ncbi:hypothetical protein AMTRI_Chr03g51210 [Amborella trichopoda]